MKDDVGKRVKAGDWIRFNYGIPGVRVTGKLVTRGGKLVVLTPGHKPASCQLRLLRKHVGEWWKVVG